MLVPAMHTDYGPPAVNVMGMSVTICVSQKVRIIHSRKVWDSCLVTVKATCAQIVQNNWPDPLSLDFDC